MANTIGPPPTGTGWDEDAPVANTDPHGNACYEIRDLRKGLRIRLSKEHVALAANSAGGEHKQGSAVAWIQATEPTTRPDGETALTSADLGRIWVDTANKAIKVLTAVGTPNTWTPAGALLLGLYTPGSEPGNGLYMKGNELYFKGADGIEKFLAGLIDEDDMTSNSATRSPSEQSVKAFVESGAVTMTNKTLTSPVLNTQVTGSAVLDEDDLASNSATKIATQQSIKAYVDARVGRLFAGSQTPVFNGTMSGVYIWQDLDLSSVVGHNLALVHLEVSVASQTYYGAKPKGWGDIGVTPNNYGGPSAVFFGGPLHPQFFTVMTDANGVIQHAASQTSSAITVKIVGYIK